MIKDLFKTLCWTIVVILTIGVVGGTFILVGFLIELCPTPSPLVANILKGCLIFSAFFFMVHIFRHPSPHPLNDFFGDWQEFYKEDSDSPD